MKTAAALPPEQQKTKDLFNTTSTRASMVGGILCIVLWVSVCSLFKHLGWKDFASRLADFGGLAAIFGSSMGNWWGCRQVRRAGLSHESQTIEVIPNIATHSSEEPIEWESNVDTTASRLCFVFLFLLLSTVPVFLWYYIKKSLDIQFEAVFTFSCSSVFLLCVGLALGFWFSTSPWLRIDQTGITLLPNSRWRRRTVCWEDLGTCEIKRVTDIFGNRLEPTCTLKDKSGAVIFKVPFLLSRLSIPQPGQSNRRVDFETEIKRRLSG